MDILFGKKILLLYPFGATKHYGESIKSELLRRGADVTGYDERPSQNSLIKIILRLFKKKMPGIFLLYIKSIIRKNPHNNFDYILVLRGEAFSERAVSELRSHYHKAVLIIYLWDILKTTNLKDVIPYFDKALSFDIEDAGNNDCLSFRPTFFVPEYINMKKKAKPEIDIFFVGTLHSNRYKLLSGIKAYLDRNQISYYFYYYVPGALLFLINSVFKKHYARLNEVHLNPLSLHSALEIVANSRCILDINYPGQKSLSMRAYEAMASKTKYITTNSEVKKYDFYSPNNVWVLDEDKIQINREFIDSPFEDISKELIEKYSVKQFVEDIFSDLSYI
jgi:hypothetical protein